jgi:hypothetical protein
MAIRGNRKNDNKHQEEGQEAAEGMTIRGNRKKDNKHQE